MILAALGLMYLSLLLLDTFIAARTVAPKRRHSTRGAA